MPLLPASLSVIVNRTMASALGPSVIQFLEPLMTYSSPLRTAVGLLRRRVAAGLGLGEAEAAELLAAREGHEELLLLLLGAELHAPDRSRASCSRS